MVYADRAARLLFQLPRTCRTFTVLQPAVQWGWGEILTNKMVYLLDLLVWQKSRDAQRKIPQHKPKPFVPDFMAVNQSTPGEISKGALVAATEDIQAILDMPRV